MKQHVCRVIEQRGLCKDIWRLRLESAPLVQEAQAGQFVHLRVGERIAPLLRRPFGIHRIDEKAGQFEVLYRAVGEGTALMTRFRPGDTVDVLGPLGHGFTLDGDYHHAVVAAGGMGIAPVFFLMDELLKRKKKVTLFWGARLCEEIFVKPGELEKAGVEVHLAVEEGNLGHAGFVTDLLPSFLSAQASLAGYRGFACGPNPMLRTLQSLVDPSAMDWEVSLEARMACGVGVCMGCGVNHVEGDYRMVCAHGPVMKLQEVRLDD